MSAPSIRVNSANTPHVRKGLPNFNFKGDLILILQAS